MWAVACRMCSADRAFSGHREMAINAALTGDPTLVYRASATTRDRSGALAGGIKQMTNELFASTRITAAVQSVSSLSVFLSRFDFP